MKIKLFILSTVWVLLGVFASGCIVIGLNGCSMQSVKGSGNIISESRHVSGFKEIELKGQGKVELTKGSRPSLEVTTDDNILPSIETVVKDGKLIISHEKGKNLRPTKLNYTITVKDLQGASITGSGDITGKSRFVSEDFYTYISGSGNIRLDLNTAHLTSNIAGSGSIQLTGKSNFHDASITGSGKIRAFDMETKNASVTITGSGDCWVNVSKKLRVKITGSGDVRYKGHPQIIKKITGSGSVNDRN
jgi:hypothetical protein